MRLDDLVRRADELIASGERAVPQAATGIGVPDIPYAEFKSASLSFLDQTFGPETAYSVQFRREVTTAHPLSVKRGLGILKGARGELAGGWVTTTRGPGIGRGIR